jgi:hypothetical protein
METAQELTMAATPQTSDDFRRLLEELRTERQHLAQTVRSLEQALTEAGLSAPTEVPPGVLQAFHEMLQLPRQDQEAIAARMLEEIEDERKWNASFAATGGKLDGLVDEALRDIRAGRTPPLDPDRM